MYVVIARYTVRPGEEEAVETALRAMTPLSRAEPGCVAYQAQRSLDNPSVFVLYESYVDEGAYKAHAETAHFKRYVLEDAVPRLVSRDREFFETVA
jgi:autoinducer 2-degrading protein